MTTQQAIRRSRTRSTGAIQRTLRFCMPWALATAPMYPDCHRILPADVEPNTSPLSLSMPGVTGLH